MKKIKLVILGVCGLLLLATLNYYAKQQFLKKEAQKKDQLRQELGRWEKITSVSPTYRDAYVQLAIGYQQLGETEKAKVFLQKVFETDPNWQVPPVPMEQLRPLLQE